MCLDSALISYRPICYLSIVADSCQFKTDELNACFNEVDFTLGC